MAEASPAATLLFGSEYSCIVVAELAPAMLPRDMGGLAGGWVLNPTTLACPRHASAGSQMPMMT